MNRWTHYHQTCRESSDSPPNHFILTNSESIASDGGLPSQLTLHSINSSIGIPYIERVLVENLQNDNSIQMLSISGNTVHFHCSFFEDKVNLIVMIYSISNKLLLGDRLGRKHQFRSGISGANRRPR